MAFVRPSIPPLPLRWAAETIRGALTVAVRALVPGHVALLELVTGGWISQAIHAAATLGVADELADEPRSAAELAAAVGADEDALQRLLRLLTSYGIFTQQRDGRYALTPMAQPLRRDAEVTLRDAVLLFGSPMHRDHWSYLVESIRSGEPAAERVRGMPLFDYLQRDREFGELFDRAMASMDTLALKPLLAAYDFGRYETIVDVAGGTGTVLTEILRHTPESRGILFDLPDVVRSAPRRIEELGLTDRCAVESGSFFDRVPEGGDAYILKYIVHDWNDRDAGRILDTLRAAMSPHARLLLLETILPGHSRPHFGKVLDLEMLVQVTGRERTLSGYRELLAHHGFTLLQQVPTTSPVHVIEARPS
ncbi:methyltransferase [Nocardia sp. CNY236]|uniref:methyltransferase n=1 Tax=Nocardia sp. CNY236 TaxID=1169152 RepID=UPI0004920219|nr:methyltransferase [Nocardia sp. CNY236]